MGTSNGDPGHRRRCSGRCPFALRRPRRDGRPRYRGRCRPAARRTAHRAGRFPKLNGADTAPADGSGNFTVTGTARWLHYDALHVKFTFFASNGDDGGALQCLIAVTDTRPPLERRVRLHRLAGYVDLSPQGVTQGLRRSFLTTIDFDQVSFSFSSYDLSKPTTLSVGDPPAAGLAFTASVDAVADVFKTVTEVAGTLGTLAVSGAVTKLTDAPELAVRCSFTGATLTLSKEISLDLTALVIRSGLSADTPVGPSLEIDARLANPLHPLDLVVRFGVGSGTIAIEAAFEDGGVFSLNDLAGLLGLDANDLASALPGEAHARSFASRPSRPARSLNENTPPSSNAAWNRDRAAADAKAHDHEPAGATVFASRTSISSDGPPGVSALSPLRGARSIRKSRDLLRQRQRGTRERAPDRQLRRVGELGHRPADGKGLHATSVTVLKTSTTGAVRRLR